jgi:glycosyltransferase involved in cell wall biosynthesis
MNIAVVIPTKNEAATITDVIRTARTTLNTVGHECTIYVADDSHDDTRNIAVREGAIVVRGSGEGLGTAMFRGLKAASRENPDAIVSIDGDGQADVESELLAFLQPVLDNTADLVIGSRFKTPGLVSYDYRAKNRFGTRVLVGMLRRRTGLPLTDSHGGIRAMSCDVVRDLEMIGTHTYVQETIIDAHEKGFRVLELPTRWLPRKHGKSRVVRSIPRYVLYTLPVLLLRSGKHIRWLYSLGAVSFLSGFLFFGVILVQEGFTYSLAERLPGLTLVALLVTTGLQLFFFGFVLQLLKQIKRRVD